MSVVIYSLVVAYVVVVVAVAWFVPWLTHRRQRTWRKIRRLQMQNDMMQIWSEASEQTSHEIWGWLVKANARRKRLEKCLRRQRAFGESMHRNNVNRLADINGLIKEVRRLKAENDSLTRMHRSLAGELVSEVLAIEDRQTVTKGLTRKL